jgi:hypothetical protein
MFIVVPFTIVKLYNQSGCSSMDELIKKMGYVEIDIHIFISLSIYLSISTIEFYLSIKKNEIMSFAGDR